jgi:hypothetical protein
VARACARYSRQRFFRNNGYSSVCTFTYGNIAASLADGITLTLNTAGTGTRKGDAWWNVSATFTNYKLEVRKTGNPDYEWFPYESITGELKIYQLEPATQYECRVKGLIGTEYESEWSNISVFTTQPLIDYACGSTTQPPGEINFTPLTNAIAGLTFEIGQFELLVTDIEPLDPILQPGHYRGTGKIAVGFAIINVRVSFDDILVDDNLMVRSGKVEAITEGMDAWLAGTTEPDYYVDGTITDFEWVDSTSLTVWVDGVQQTFSFSDHDPLVIQDEDGMIYTFHSDGTYTVISILVYSTDVLAGTADYRIDFAPDPNQIYGFDKKEYAAWLRDYDVIRLLDSSNYFVSYKSLAPDQTDYVIANVTSENPLSNVTFVATEPGTTFNLSSTQINDSTYRVSLAGMNSSMYVYAEDDGNRIGKLWVKVLPAIEKEIVFVPVNGASLSQIADIENELNEIYIQANVSFDVTTKSNYQSSTWDLNTDGKMQTGDVDLMSHYSEEMRLLRDEYFASDTSYNKNAYYIFIIPQFLQEDLGGYMVRGKGVGFLKNGESPRTAAHELAHGIFGLEHTFPAIEEGSTENLLDYSATGKHLAQKQWYYMHNPLPAFSFLDDEEEGAYVLSTMDYKCIPASLSKTTEIEYYYDLDGNVLLLSSDYEPYAFVGNSEGLEQYFGRLAAIRRVSDNKLFLPKKSYQDNKYGYFSHHFGIYEEFVYEQFDETQNPEPLRIEINSLCEYEIYRGNNVTSQGSYNDCESCADFIRDQNAANSSSYFEEVDPNFYVTPFDGSEEFVTAYNEAVDEAVLIINASISNWSTSYPTDVSTKIHIVNYNQYATTTTEGIAGLKAETLASIELKLQDLYRTSHDHDNPIHFVVLFQYIDFIMENRRWNSYAGDIIEQSDLDDYENVVLITIPYASPLLFSTGTNPQKPEWMPGLSFDKPNLVNTSTLGNPLYDPENFTSFILDVFQATVKPYDTYTYAIDLYGRIQFSKLSPTQWVSGYSKVNDLRLIYDENLEDYDHSLEIEQEQQSNYQSSQNSYVQLQNAEFMSSFREKEWAYSSGDYQTRWIAPHVNLFDYHIRQFHAQYVNHFITDEFENYRVEYGLNDPGSVPAYAKINPLEDDAFLDLVDFFSILTSPLGGDAFFDAIGVIYVSSIDPSNTFEISTRSLAVTLPFMTGGVVRVGKEGVESVTVNSLKQFGKKSLGQFGWIDELLVEGWTGELKLALKSDLEMNPNLFGNAINVDGAEAWKLLRSKIQNPSPTNTTYLFRNTEAIEALTTIRKNPKLNNFGISDDMLVSIQGFNVGGLNVSYNQALAKIDELISFLPPNTNNLQDFVGSAGWANASQHTRRSAYVTTEYLLSNKSMLQGATIEFEKDITYAGVNSATDVYVRKGDEIIHIETKAGDEFFTFVNTGGSNFSSQSYNMLMDANKIENIKVPLNTSVKNSLLNPSTFAQQKNRVVDAWLSFNNGQIFSESSIRAKFSEYFDVYIDDAAELEELLRENDNWFLSIFLNNNL